MWHLGPVLTRWTGRRAQAAGGEAGEAEVVLALRPGRTCQQVTCWGERHWQPVGILALF